MKTKNLSIKGIAVFTVLVLTFVLVGSVLAVHDLGLFELDRNAEDPGGVSPPDDWATLYGGGGSPAAFTGVIVDTGGTGTQFQGGGSKDNNNLNQWLWKAGEPLDKDDITNAYAAAYSYTGPEVCPSGVPSGDPSCTQPGDLIVYYGLDRFANNGSAQVGFWFFQNAISLSNTPSGGGFLFNGVHTVGDILVQSNFSQGGVISSISVFKWVGSGGSHGTLDLILSAADCVGSPTGDLACATANQGNTPAPWPYTPKSGTPGIFPQGSFFEGGLNITRLVPEVECITTFMAETRSSTPFDARLKDFAGPAAFNLCGASIQIEADATNEVGQDHTFTVTVNKTFSGVSTPAPDGTTVDVTLTDANGAVSSVSSDTCASPGTVNGTCTVTFTSNSAGTVTGHAAADVDVDGFTIHVETDGVAPNSDDAVKTFVDAFITIGTDATNSVGENHTFTITVQQNAGDGAGFVNAPDGTIVTVTLTDANGAVSSVSSNTCASPGTSGGTCTITFTSNTAGTVTGHASVTFSVGGISLTRETDGSGQNSGDATKIFVGGSLAWTKVDNAGALLGGATFQVCRTHDRFGVDIPDECVTVTDNTAPDVDGDAGEFMLTGLLLGRYTVVETIAPPGFEPDPDTVTVELTVANPNGTIAVAFVNQRPILKLTAFGYTNEPTGTPTAGIVSGTTTYTVKLKNFGGASASLSGTLAATTNSAGGSLSCPGSPLAISGSVAPGAEVTFTLTCTYTNLDDGAVVTANLSAVDYTLNGLTRTASGTPASISFTVQSD